MNFLGGFVLSAITRYIAFITTFQHRNPMRPTICLFLLTVTLLNAEPASVAPPSPAVVADFKLDAAYTKCVLVGDFPVVSTHRTEDRALLEAAWLIAHMLDAKSPILAAMAQQKVRFAIMAKDEFTTTIPEHATLTPSRYWDKRARGLGASKERPAVTCGEENLLCLPGDPYSTENILIHEFSHAIHLMGLNLADPTFDKRLLRTYKTAMAAGLWKNKYASVNHAEYWAEGTQSWFDTNRENDHDHNHVNTRAELKEYDPALAKLCEEIYGDSDWRYQRPEQRATVQHFAGWDFRNAPKFSWPAELQQWTEKELSNPDIRPQGLNPVPWRPLAIDAKPPASTDKAGGECSLIIANATGRELSMSWVDSKGSLVPHGTVRSKFVSIQHTYPGHVWLITEEDGTPLGYGIAQPGDGRVLVLEKP
jgi:hypothetical protein